MGSLLDQLINLAAEAGPSSALSKVSRLRHALTSEVWGFLAKSMLAEDFLNELRGEQLNGARQRKETVGLLHGVGAPAQALKQQPASTGLQVGWALVEGAA